MNRITSLIVILLSLGAAARAQTAAPGYNKALADSLGGDDYGMKMYTFVILKTGTAVINDQKMKDSLFAGHMANIGRLAKEGKLVVAGPFGSNDKNYRGLFILNVKTEAEAKSLLDTDPVVKSKLMEAEIYAWYGSAALGQYLPFHKMIERKKM